MISLLKKNDEIIIGVTIHHIYYKYYFGRELYVEIMSEIFNKILESYKSKILIILMEDGYLANGGDKLIAEEMVNRINEKERIKIVDRDLSLMDTANIISHTDIFIGTKTHSIVYALKTGTPVISISYQKKSTEFMKQFCVEDYVINMSELLPLAFMLILDKLIQERDVARDILKRQYLIVQNQAERNNILRKALIKND